MRELVCNGYLWARGASGTRSDNESIFQQQFDILTAAQSLGSQDYYKKSRMTVVGLAGVLFCENEQA